VSYRALRGRGSVFLNTDFSRYILADINSDLISLYNIVKLRTDEYVAEARKLFTPENNNLTFTIQFRMSLIRARIRSAARCCSCI
jgi:DNA adenine methylase